MIYSVNSRKIYKKLPNELQKHASSNKLDQKSHTFDYVIFDVVYLMIRISAIHSVIFYIFFPNLQDKSCNKLRADFGRNILRLLNALRKSLPYCSNYKLSLN